MTSGGTANVMKVLFHKKSSRLFSGSAGNSEEPPHIIRKLLLTDE